MKETQQQQNLNGKKKRAWLTTGEGFRRIDAFGQKLPNFNIKGTEQVNTIFGGIFSLVLFMTVFMYGTLKFSHLITKHNPQISSYLKENEMSGVSLNINEKKYRIAFTIESYMSPKKQKSDPRFVKYLFRLYGKRNGKEYEKVLTYHNCTDADYEEFNPVKKQSEKLL